MAEEHILEQRIVALEAAVRELQSRLPLPTQAPAPDWLDKVIGSMKDEPAFLEVMEYGRAFRQADCLPEEEEGKHEIPPGHGPH